MRIDNKLLYRVAHCISAIIGPYICFIVPIQDRNNYLISTINYFQMSVLLKKMIMLCLCLTARRWEKNRRKRFALIAIDDSSIVNGKAIRSSFRMHPGKVSLGCITFMHQSVFEHARQFILETASETVDTAGSDEYVHYGILKVSAG